MRRFVALVGCLVLVGCDKPAASNGGHTDASAASSAADAAAEGATNTSNSTTASDAKPSVTPAASAPILAYSYDLAVEAPADRIKDLAARHEAACVAAGPSVCQITGSTLEAKGRDSVTASLQLRAAPAWLMKFRGTIAADAVAAGGRLANATTTSEDLSRQIVDTEAEVRAKTALRDRLQTILETRPGKMEDLVDLETSIARIQGELDATQSELAMFRERVATSEMSIAYDSSGVLAPEGTFGPLGRAVDGFTGNVVGALAVMVEIISLLLPWALVGGLVWVFRGRIARLFGGGRRLTKPVNVARSDGETRRLSPRAASEEESPKA